MFLLTEPVEAKVKLEMLLVEEVVRAEVSTSLVFEFLIDVVSTLYFQPFLSMEMEQLNPLEGMEVKALEVEVAVPSSSNTANS
jgi:hypothetical protein